MSGAARLGQASGKGMLGAQETLGLGDFNDIPDGDDEPDLLQMGRLRLRYVLFR